MKALYRRTIRTFVAEMAREFTICCFIVLSGTIVGCSAGKTTTVAGETRKEVRKAFRQAKADNYEISAFDRTKYYVVDREIGPDSDKSELYSLLKTMKPGRVYGPTESNGSLYYHLVKDTFSVEYVDFQLSQIQQPFGIGDVTFQMELDSIHNKCMTGRKLLDETLEGYRLNANLRAGLTLQMHTQRMDELAEEVRLFINDAELFAIYQTDKVEMPGITIIELIQKTSNVRLLKHIKYIQLQPRPTK